MKKQLSIFLLLLVVLPLLILTWMGLRLLGNERIIAEHQRQQLAESQLKVTQATIHSFFEALQRDSIDALEFLDVADGVDSKDIQLIRGLIESDPYLEQIFVLNANREVLFPTRGVNTSNKEEEFLDASLEMFLDDKTFRSNRSGEAEVAVSVDGRRGQDKVADKNLFDVFRTSSQRTRQSKQVLQSYGEADRASGAQQVGWTTWDAGTRTQIYFWFTDQQKNLIGQKLSGSYWLSQLISQLPNESQSNYELGTACIRLVDKRQRIAYQWGQYKPSDGAEAQSQILLTHPLDGWLLQYHSSTGGDNYMARLTLFVTLLLCLALLLAAVGWLIWRSYQREMRVAQQRVSFVNQVSHELKTPLTNICMYADLLEDEVIDNRSPDRSRVKKFSDVLTSESQRLGRLINNVLSFSTIQEKKIALNPSTCVIDDLILQSARAFEAAFAVKGIEFDFQLKATEKVHADAQVVEQVMNNLLSNIEKYAAGGKLARITSRCANGITHILVADAGPGVSKKLRADLFKPFVRGSNALTEGATGTGIGLNIARHLCRLHGGDLSVKESSSSGTTFLVELQTPRVEMEVEEES